jgi:hypothetical protein
VDNRKARTRDRIRPHTAPPGFSEDRSVDFMKWMKAKRVFHEREGYFPVYGQTQGRVLGERVEPESEKLTLSGLIPWRQRATVEVTTPCKANDHMHALEAGQSQGCYTKG